MEVSKTFSYRNSNPDWINRLINSLKQIPDSIFFEEDGTTPLAREVTQIDARLFKLLLAEFGEGVEKDFSPMAPLNQFSVDLFLPTKPATLVEIEKGKLPRLELDLMKIMNSIFGIHQNMVLLVL